MSDKPTRKYLVPLPTEIKSDHVQKYPVDIVKEAYVRWDGTIKSFCRKFGLPKNIVEKYIKAGDWNGLRDSYRQKFYNILRKERLEILEQKQSVLQRAEMFKLMAIEGEMADLEQHVKEWGDFFCRDEEGNVLRDKFGNPISRKVGVDSFDLKFLKEAEISRETNHELMEKASVDVITEEKTIDVDQFGLFEKKES